MEEGQMSFFDEKPMEAVTVKELNELCEQAFLQREKVEEAKKAYKEEDEKLDKLQATLIEYLNHVGHSSWKTDHGTITRVERWSVTVPKTKEDKLLLFAYLQEKDMFFEMVNINSKSLQGFYREEQEEAVRSGKVLLETDFKIPGIGEPKMVQTISMRRK